MQLNDDEIDLLERLDKGTLSSGEKAALEARLRSDDRFRAEAELFSDFLVALRANEDAALKQMLVDEEAHLRSKNQPRREATTRQLPGRRWAWLAAASIALFAAGYWLLNTRQPDPPQLFADYFQPYPNAIYPIERGGTADSDPVVAAFSAYSEGEYAKALSAFDLAIGQQPADRGLVFYKAIALLADGSAGQAVPLLQATAADAQSPFRQQATWYLALAYLKLGDLENGRLYLQQLSTAPAGFKQAEATALLGSL